MHDALRAGAALFAAGHYRAAHEPWEEVWHDVRAADGDDAEESDDRDERLLQGLVQYAAAVHHARERNWAGATGLAESGREYLDGLPNDYRDVRVGSVREALAALEADPERVERRSPEPVVVDGEVPALTDLDLDATLLAAPALAEALGYDEEFDVETGVEYARRDVADGSERSKFVRFVFDFVRDAEHRAIVAQRLDQHVDRRRRKEEDVKGLFG
ncbi:DUF309 domain-containing protein [Halospeciosus flavus]|uniref:DUF309 domain-containing protein n=1 Tax=Halospeciosus flavus TaxID=3032283 RepID=A0ABD5Z5V9_9EURY|nr:DUF309 domain-containing protein [Halospeciosus flavus]